MAEQSTTLYKYVSLEYLPNTLNDQRIYLNNGKEFNDPFDITITDKKDGIARKLDGLHILSLTNSPRKKLMWQHYANSHKGACLAISVPKQLVYPIVYTSKRVFTDTNVDELIETNVVWKKKGLEKDFSLLSYAKKIAYIKDKKWVDENEYRIVLDADDENEWVFEPKKRKWFIPVKIERVYLGASFALNDEKAKEKVLEACKQNKVETKKMVLSKTNYALEVKDYFVEQSGVAYSLNIKKASSPDEK